METDITPEMISEYRFMPSKLELGEGNTVVGTAIVYDRESEPMPLSGGRAKVIEVIRPGAARNALQGDTLALFHHNPADILGRTSSGTLSLSESATGVHYRINLPDTQLGRDVRELVKRGDIRGASFKIDVPKGADKWTRNTDGMLYREVMKLGSLPEISLTAAPAYPDTTATLRSLQEWMIEHKGIPLSIRIRQARIASL